MRILAFDTATNTGLAFGIAGGQPIAWSVSLGQVAWPVRFARLMTLTERCVLKYQPDLVVVEEFVGGPKANTNLAGLVAIVQGQSKRMGCQVASYWPSTVRKGFLGGVPKKDVKQHVFRRCHELGWAVPDTDAADAAALWSHACSIAAPNDHQIVPGGLFK